MSSPSAAAAIFPVPEKHLAALMSANEPDSGEPITDLPPLIEPEAPPTSHRPSRRSFLAPVAAAPPEVATATAPAPGVVAQEIPALIEPFAETVTPAPVPAPAPIAQPTRWLAAARARLSGGRRPGLTAGLAAAVVLVLIVLIADIVGVGPFSRVRHYPASAAPSDPAQRFAYYQAGARAGDANAELQLGILYAKGEGVAQDYTNAATWFRAAANQGVTRAQYDLGVIYERGRGLPVDLTEAANWYLKAAQGNFPLAQYNLAVCYTKGQGIRKDLAEAALWYRRAAVQGVVQAMINLGMVYEKGDGVTASPVDAYAWYSAAGRRGDPAAARRAEDLFAALPQLDQIRAQALTSDVAASIHDPERSDAGAAAPDASGR